MKREEKVMAEWPKELRDEAQALEPLPEDQSTDYLVVRLQGTNNKAYMAEVAAVLQDLQLSQAGDVRVNYTAVFQRINRWQPLNSWTVVRGIFDWIMSFGREVANKDIESVQKKQAARDARRTERAAR